MKVHSLDLTQPKRCWTCNEYKPREEFIGRQGKSCQACRASDRPKWSKAKQRAARYRADRIRTLEQNREWKEANALRYRSQQREYVQARKLERRQRVLDHYGAYCACCREPEVLFLTIDHLNDDGWQHRRKIGVTDMWAWLVANGFPPGFRILCYNCNAGRYRNGGRCPHEEAIADAVAE